jgi:hypothetical protein
VHTLASKQGGIRGESIDSIDRISNSVLNNALFGVGGWRNRRARAAGQMCIAFVLMQACWGYSELPEEKASRHTVRLGT